MDQHNQYYLFADESVQDGPLFSNFYGGALVPQPAYESVRSRLIAAKNQLGFQGTELKWQKVTAQDLDSYKKITSAFFAEMREGHLTTSTTTGKPSVFSPSPLGSTQSGKLLQKHPFPVSLSLPALIHLLAPRLEHQPGFYGWHAPSAAPPKGSANQASKVLKHH